jgi:hypothetical protein
MDSVRAVLLPVAIHMHPAHIVDSARSGVQQKIVATKKKTFTDQQLQARTTSKSKEGSN